MTEPHLQALFRRLADSDTDPVPVDTQRVLQRGRTRLRWRRAFLAGAPVLAAVTVVAVVTGAGALRPGHAPAPVSAGPAAPRHFNLLISNVSFGWLPAGQSVQQGGVLANEAFLVTGSKSASIGWSFYAYARGTCQLAVPATVLDCPGSQFSLSGPAPAVNGHRAFWSGASLIWEYARGGWAWLLAPIASDSMLADNPAARGKAARIAAHTRVGAGTPALLFPARLPGLASTWRIREVQHYEADAGVLAGEQYILTSGTSQFLPHVGDEGIFTHALYVQIDPAPHYDTCSPNDPSFRTTRETINGYPVVVKRMNIRPHLPTQELCTGHADGLWVDIQEFGTHPPVSVAGVFRHHVQLLGTQPANWTQNPLG